MQDKFFEPPFYKAVFLWGGVWGRAPGEGVGRNEVRPQGKAFPSLIYKE